MNRRNRALLGPVTMLGSLLAGCGQQPPNPQIAANPTPKVEPLDYEYGPKSAEDADRGQSVISLFQKHGAPLATYQVGEQTIYRWGHGKVTRDASNQGTIARDELLVTTDRAGKIVEASFKAKVSMKGDYGAVMDVPH